MRRAARTDNNQTEIVKALRDIPGVTVALCHDDILVGRNKKTYWFELKNPDRLFKKDGVTFNKGVIKESQTKIRKTWTGHYDIVWSLDMILYALGISK